MADFAMPRLRPAASREADWVGGFSIPPHQSAEVAGGESVGIGVILSLSDRGDVIVDDLAPGWPAALTGLLVRGDALLRVDGTPLATLAAKTDSRGASRSVGERLTAVRQLIVGPCHSVVTLTVRQADGKIRDIEILRQKGPRQSTAKMAASSAAARGKENMAPSSHNAHRGSTRRAGQPLPKLSKQHGDAKRSALIANASTVSAVLQSSSGANMGAKTADWDSKILHPDEDSGKGASDPRRPAGSVSTKPQTAAIAGCDAGILDLDALPGPPPAQHVGIYSPSAADGKRTETQAPQGEEQSLLNGLPGALPLPTPLQTAQPPVQMARAIYEHKAERYDELSFLPGELLTILGPGQDQGWMHATNQRMAKGLIPHNYVQMLPGPTPAPSVKQLALVHSSRLSHSTESSPASIHLPSMDAQETAGTNVTSPAGMGASQRSDGRSGETQHSTPPAAAAGRVGLTEDAEVSLKPPALCGFSDTAASPARLHVSGHGASAETVADAMVQKQSPPVQQAGDSGERATPKLKPLAYSPAALAVTSPLEADLKAMSEIQKTSRELLLRLQSPQFQLSPPSPCGVGQAVERSSVPSSACELSASPPHIECDASAFPQLVPGLARKTLSPPAGGNTMVQRRTDGEATDQAESCAPSRAPALAASAEDHADANCCGMAAEAEADGAKQALHTSPLLEPPVSYRSAACDDSRDEGSGGTAALLLAGAESTTLQGAPVPALVTPEKAAERTRERLEEEAEEEESACITPGQLAAQQAPALCRALTDRESLHDASGESHTSALTPWNPGDKHVWGRSLVARLRALGCEERLIEACQSAHDLEALYDILTGKFDGVISRPPAHLADPLNLAGEAARGSTQDHVCGTVQRFESEPKEGESMARVIIYAARNVPTPDNLMAAFCEVSCGTVSARSSLVATHAHGRKVVYNEHFDIPVDLSGLRGAGGNGKHEICIALFQRLCGAMDGDGVGAGFRNSVCDELVGQVRIKTSAILSSLRQESLGAGAGEDVPPRKKDRACCEGWYDVCLHGHPVRGAEGVVGLHLRVCLSGIRASPSSSPAQPSHTVGDAAALQWRPDMVLVEHHKTRRRSGSQGSELHAVAGSQEEEVTAEVLQQHRGDVPGPSGEASDVRARQVESHRVSMELQRGISGVQVPGTVPGPPSPNTKAKAWHSSPKAGDTTQIGAQMAQEMAEMAAELSTLRRQPLWGPGCSSSVSPGTVDTTSSSSSRDSRRGYEESRAAVDREILRSLRAWGLALHRVRPSIGPDDALYATIEWLVQVLLCLFSVCVHFALR